MPRLLPAQLQHRPRIARTSSTRAGIRLGQPLFPACTSPQTSPAEPKAPNYFGRQALREALLAALFTSLLTTAVQAAPQLFSQSPAESVHQIKAMVLPGLDDSAQPRLVDCP